MGHRACGVISGCVPRSSPRFNQLFALTARPVGHVCAGASWGHPKTWGRGAICRATCRVDSWSLVRTRSPAPALVLRSGAHRRGRSARLGDPTRSARRARTTLLDLPRSQRAQARSNHRAPGAARPDSAPSFEPRPCLLRLRSTRSFPRCSPTLRSSSPTLLGLPLVFASSNAWECLLVMMQAEGRHSILWAARSTAR